MTMPSPTGWGSARPPSAATSRPSSTDSASGAGLPQVQLPSDEDGLVSQHSMPSVPMRRTKRLPFVGLPQLRRAESVTEPLEVESRDGTERRFRARGTFSEVVRERDQNDQFGPAAPGPESLTLPLVLRVGTCTRASCACRG